MPQPSVAYACGRIGVLKRNALHSAQLERLLSARSYEEALRTLSDVGFAAADAADFQTAADLHVKKACELIKAVSPEPKVTDCFLLRYDAHNLKVLLKSRFLAQKPEFLSTCGTMDVEKLRHAVAEHSYQPLPECFRMTLEALEKQLSVRFDPMRIDTELDQAMYRQAFEWLKGTRVRVALEYFRAKADLQNLVMLLRAKAMHKDAKFFEQLALEGGNIQPKAFVQTAEEPDKLAKLVRRYGNAVYQAAMSAAMDSAKLPRLEKEADDYLYGLFKPYRYQNDTMESLIAYLLQNQREATDVRLILTGKLNGFADEAITERVRELHG